MIGLYPVDLDLEFVVNSSPLASLVQIPLVFVSHSHDESTPANLPARFR